MNPPLPITICPRVSVERDYQTVERGAVGAGQFGLAVERKDGVQTGQGEGVLYAQNVAVGVGHDEKVVVVGAEMHGIPGTGEVFGSDGLRADPDKG